LFRITHQIALRILEIQNAGVQVAQTNCVFTSFLGIHGIMMMYNNTVLQVSLEEMKKLLLFSAKNLLYFLPLSQFSVSQVQSVSGGIPVAAWVPQIRQIMISLSESESRSYDISDSQKRSESDMKAEIYRHLRDGCVQQMKLALAGLKVALVSFSKREKERVRPSSLSMIISEGVKDLWGFCT
jgi:hypothetical protein